MSMNLAEEKAGLDKLWQLVHAGASLDDPPVRDSFTSLIEAGRDRACRKEPRLASARASLQSYMAQGLVKAVSGGYRPGGRAKFHVWVFYSYWDARKRARREVLKAGRTVSADATDEEGNSPGATAIDSSEATRALGRERRSRERDDNQGLIEWLFGRQVTVMTALDKRQLYRRLALPPQRTDEATPGNGPAERAPPAAAGGRVEAFLRRRWWRLQRRRHA